LAIKNQVQRKNKLILGLELEIFIYHALEMPDFVGAVQENIGDDDGDQAHHQAQHKIRPDDQYSKDEKDDAVGQQHPGQAV